MFFYASITLIIDVFVFVLCVHVNFILLTMSFLIDDILKDKTYKKQEDSKINETNTKIGYSQNNISILECSLRNRFYYHSFLSQNEVVNYNSLSSSIYKNYTDYYTNNCKYAYYIFCFK